MSRKSICETTLQRMIIGSVLVESHRCYHSSASVVLRKDSGIIRGGGHNVFANQLVVAPESSELGKKRADKMSSFCVPSFIHDPWPMHLSLSSEGGC